MASIRQPIVAVLGHVDHGKTTLLDRIRGTGVAGREAGGITQHIGATEDPLSAILEMCGDLVKGKSFRSPGLLFIDTPGHVAFSTLRARGGALADLAVLVIDVNEGFRPQTIESLNILKRYKTPFVVAANKIDLVPGWRKHEGQPFVVSYRDQAESVRDELDKRMYELIGRLLRGRRQDPRQRARTRGRGCTPPGREGRPRRGDRGGREGVAGPHRDAGRRDPREGGRDRLPRRPRLRMQAGGHPHQVRAPRARLPARRDGRRDGQESAPPRDPRLQPGDPPDAKVAL